MSTSTELVESSLAERATQIPPEMIEQIATGMDDPSAIAYRFGWTFEDYLQLANYEPFVKCVDAVRAQLHASGKIFELKSALRAETMLDRCFRTAMLNETTFPQQLEALRTFAKLGNLEPKPSAGQAQVGTGFSISINFNSPGKPAIEATAVREQDVD